jgi:hypothetical protein
LYVFEFHLFAYRKLEAAWYGSVALQDYFFAHCKGRFIAPCPPDVLPCPQPRPQNSPFEYTSLAGLSRKRAPLEIWSHEIDT